MNLPPVIRIEPASSCNLRCIHCPTGLGKSPNGIMSLELFNKILVELKSNLDHVSTVVLYHGGEPLLNINLFEFISQLKSAGIKKIKIVTNGKLFTDTICQRIVESGLDEIEISLDGLSQDESREIRKRSEPQKIINGINYLIQQRKKLQSSIKITISTTQFIEDYHTDYNEIRKAPIPGWLNEYKNNGVEIKSNWAIQWPGGFPSDSTIVHHPLYYTPPKNCSLLSETMTVRANGDVVVCCFDLTSLEVIGNVEAQSMHEIWNSIKYEDFRKKFLLGKYQKPCDTCFIVTGPKYLGKNKLLEVISE